MRHQIEAKNKELCLYRNGHIQVCDENAKRKTPGFSFLYCDDSMGD